MPTSLKIGMVRQEAPGGDMTPLDAVLAADTFASHCWPRPRPQPIRSASPSSTSA